MHSPELSAYVAPARLYPQIWRLLLGIGLILLVYMGFFAIMLIAAYPVIGPLEYFPWLLGLQAPSTPGQTLFVLGSFIGMFLAPILAAAACHFRGPGSLFGPASDFFSGFFQTLLVLIPIYGLMFGLAFGVLGAPVPNLPIKTWALYLLAALPLLFVQVTAEELIFRGYIPQQLAARFQAKWVWMGLPAILFAVLHYNPAAKENTWLIVLATLLFALIAMDLTEKTGSLGAATGLHLVNNFFALLVVSVDGSITGLALYVTGFEISDTRSMLIGLVIDLVALLVIWRVLRAVLVR